MDPSMIPTTDFFYDYNGMKKEQGKTKQIILENLNVDFFLKMDLRKFSDSSCINLSILVFKYLTLDKSCKDLKDSFSFILSRSYFSNFLQRYCMFVHVLTFSF